MKPVFFILLFAMTANIVHAQEPRPEWVNQPPYPPAGVNFIYVYGMGIGINESEAELAAWKNALFKSFQEGGLIGIPNQKKTLNMVFSMNDLEMMIPAHVLPRRLVCQTPQIYLPDNKVKIYILLQVKLDGSKHTDFYNTETKISCKSEDFEKKLAEWNKTGYLREQDKSKYVNLQIIGIAVEKSDISGVGLIWSDAYNLCKNSTLAGYKDWRLPTIDELTTIFHQKNSIGGISNKWYWSSTYSDIILIYTYDKKQNRYTIDMTNGKKGNVNEEDSIPHCRCVRTLP